MTLYFPDADEFPELALSDDESPPKELSEWVQIKAGTLRYRVDALVQQQSFRRRRFSAADISASVFVRFANEVFGFDGWSTEVVACDSVFEHYDSDSRKHSAKYMATVKMTLNHGDFVLEALGTGRADNAPHRYLCLNKCKKEAVTSATKQCLLHLCSFVIEDDIRIKQE